MGRQKATHSFFLKYELRRLRTGIYSQQSPAQSCCNSCILAHEDSYTNLALDWTCVHLLVEKCPELPAWVPDSPPHHYSCQRVLRVFPPSRAAGRLAGWMKSKQSQATDRNSWLKFCTLIYFEFVCLSHFAKEYWLSLFCETLICNRL